MFAFFTQPSVSLLLSTQKSFLYGSQGKNVAFMMAINTLQQLNVGQIVTLEWQGCSGCYLYDDSLSMYTHFTAQLLGSVAPMP